jgi:asparagine synthetase B (glutamine-hydrolysing)
VLVWREDDGEARVERFAQPRTARSEDERSESEEELAEELRERLQRLVRAHLIADVLVGVMLGRNRLVGAGGVRGAGELERVSTFDRFEERAFDERDRARLVAKQYGPITTSSSSGRCGRAAPEDAEIFDEPFADSSAWSRPTSSRSWPVRT